jgi:SmpA/OmlA family protein
MMMTLRILIPAALVALGAGCASYAPVPAGESAEQVQARMGRPSEVWKNADGTETWEYRQGPAGWYTYMVDLGPDRAVRSVRQVLSEEYLARVQPGMSRDDVHRLLGAPKEISHYPRSNQEVWSWRFKEQNTWYRLFLVQFDETRGTVLRTYRIDDPTYYDKGGKNRG